MNRLSIRVQIVVFTLLLLVGFAGFGSYVLLSTQEQIRENFRQSAGEAVNRLAEEIAAPLWLLQHSFVSATIQYFKSTPHLQALRLADDQNRVLFQHVPDGSDSLLTAFAESGRIEWESGGQYFVHRPIRYGDETVAHIWLAFDESTMQAAIAERRKTLLGGMLLLSIFGVLLVALLDHSLTKPLRRMRQTLAGYEPEERYPLIHLPEEGPAEVASLIHSYNRLADRVGELFRNTRRARENARGFFAEHPLPMVQTDAMWHIQEINVPAERLFGLPREAILRESLEDFLNPGEFLSAKQALRKSGAAVHGIACSLHGRLQQQGRLELYISPQHDSGDIICNYLVTLIPADEKIQARQRLIREHRKALEMNKQLMVKLKTLHAAREQLLAQQQEMAALLRAADSVLEMSAPSNILETFRREACPLLNAETCFIYLYHRSEEQLVPALLPSHANYPIGRKPAAESSIVWLAHQSGEPQLLDGVLSQVLGDGAMGPAGRHAVMALPIALGEKKLGVAVFIRADSLLFRREDANRIGLLTHNTAIALERSELIRELAKMQRERPQAPATGPHLAPQQLQQAFQAQKMESLEILVGGIAHDFNNILGIINPNVELLRMKFGDSPEIHKRLVAIQDAVDRAAHLTRQLVIFTRNDQVELQRLAPNRLVERLVSMIHRALGDHIAVKLKLAPDLPFIHADETKLSQALVNLAVNARDAMPNGGTLSFRTALETYLPPNEPGAKPQKFVKITVSDTGQGIPEKHLYKIFDPFFTTKTPHRGAGMGLAVVYGIVKSHKGYISVDTAVNKGSAFHIYLPPVAVPSRLAAPPSGTATAPTQKVRENILVVDDERMIRESLSDLLKLLGYNVYQAVGGRHAMEILKHHRDIDAAIVDFAMPQMNGIETIKALRRINSRVKFVLSSGYADQEKVVSEQKHIEAFLPKPFQLESLSYTFSKLFNGSRPEYQEETS